ncbi:hypothetical protein HYV70_02840 [Candidatus Uhrbacteria bacterium]|nr:hypothetical protein [Candidatus Uhrbacteria bacterium]
MVFGTLGLFALFVASLLSSCTQNQIAKQFGGDITVNLPPGRKLVVVTWKNDDMWHLTRPMRESEMPETSVFQEDSSFGLVEGSVTFVETK